MTTDNVYGILKLVLLLNSCLQVSSITTKYLDEQCGKIFYADPALSLKASRYNHLNTNMKCSVTIKARPNMDQLVGYVKSFSTDCFASHLDVYDGTVKDSKHKIQASFCGPRLALPFYSFNSTQHTFLFDFSTLSQQTTGYFDFTLTTYHYGHCNSGEFRCSNDRCIDRSLSCNGYNNCGDDSDEFVCDVVVLGVGVIVAIVIGSFVFVVCFPVIIVGIICRRRRRYYGQLN